MADYLQKGLEYGVRYGLLAAAVVTASVALLRRRVREAPEPFEDRTASDAFEPTDDLYLADCVQPF